MTMKEAAAQFCESQTEVDAWRCHYACMDTLDFEMKKQVQHYSTHAGLQRISASVAANNFKEAANRDCSPVEYMTKLKHLCFCLGISLS